MQKQLLLALALGACLTFPRIASASETAGMSPDKALQMLTAGNERYVAEQATHPNGGAERRAIVAKGQHPIAIILGCSDSRVAPELVYDQGLGDLFVIRVAGNIADPAVLGSIEYAVEHLGVSLIVVLGHERCGAVAAAVQSAHATGHVNTLVQAIQPAVIATKNKSGDRVDNAVRANVEDVVAEIKKSQPVLAHFVKSGKLKVVGERYDLDTGKAEILP